MVEKEEMKKNMSRRISDIGEEDLRRMYEEEGMTQVKIAEIFGVNAATISNRMKEYEIETRFDYSVNEDFFKTWTKKSSWVFGWWLGDGWIDKDNTFGFNLGRKDKEVLYKFKRELESGYPLHDFDNYQKKRFKIVEMSRLLICSRIMVSDLKSSNYEDIPDWHRSDLIRGFFEAEGSVGLYVDKRGGTYEYFRTSFAQKDPAILEWIWDVLEEEGVVVGGSLYQNRGNGCWNLHFGEADSVSLYHYMYDDCSELYLERKKNKFEELMARRGYL